MQLDFGRIERNFLEFSGYDAVEFWYAWSFKGRRSGGLFLKSAVRG